MKVNDKQVTRTDTFQLPGMVVPNGARISLHDLLIVSYAKWLERSEQARETLSSQ